MDSPAMLSAETVQLQQSDVAAAFILNAVGGDTEAAISFARATLVVLGGDQDADLPRKKQKVSTHENSIDYVETPLEDLDFSYLVNDETDSKDTSTVMLVPNKKEVLGAIIGKGGQHIKLIQSQAGAKMQLEKAPANPSREFMEITVTGTVKQINMACAMIFNKVSYNLKVKDQGSDPAAHNIKLLVPNAMVRHLIGKSGNVINTLQSTTKAHIQFQQEKDMPPNALGREVKIGSVNGDVESMLHAEYLISRQMIQEKSFDPQWANAQRKRTEAHVGILASAPAQRAPPPQHPQQQMATVPGMANPLDMMSAMAGMGYDPAMLLQLQQAQQAQLMMQMQQQQQQLQPQGAQQTGQSYMQQPQQTFMQQQQPQQQAYGQQAYGQQAYTQQAQQQPQPQPPTTQQRYGTGMGGAVQATAYGGGTGGSTEPTSKVEVQVPNWSVSRLIGKGGANIQDMTAKTGAQIHFQKQQDMAPGAESRIVTLEGTAASVYKAQQLMNAYIQQLQVTLQQQGAGQS